MSGFFFSLIKEIRELIAYFMWRVPFDGVDVAVIQMLFRFWTCLKTYSITRRNC